MCEDFLRWLQRWGRIRDELIAKGKEAQAGFDDITDDITPQTV